jgi:DivIVA domain-containing protein
MGSGAHVGASYSEGEEAGPPVWRRLGGRVRQIVRPSQPEPQTTSAGASASGIRRAPLGHLSADDVHQVRFARARYREGYDQDEVDDFLDRVERQLRGRDEVRPLTPEDVIEQRFAATRFRGGYDEDEVDDFLDRIVTELRRRQ